MLFPAYNLGSGNNNCFLLYWSTLCLYILRVGLVTSIWPNSKWHAGNNIWTSTKCKLSDVCFSDSGVSLLHKKSLEKQELCQRLKEQLDALEKETASKLSEMDSYNNQLKVFIFDTFYF